VFLIYICCPKTTKNEEKKIKYPIPPFQTAGMKKKFKKKSNMQNLSRADMCRRGGSFSPFQKAGMRKATKKRTKIESGSFWKINLIGVRFRIFLAFRVGIKKNSLKNSQTCCNHLYTCRIDFGPKHTRNNK